MVFMQGYKRAPASSRAVTTSARGARRVGRRRIGHRQSALKTNLRKQLYYFRRYIRGKPDSSGIGSTGMLSFTTGVDGYTATSDQITLAFQNVPNSAEFTALFDSYKLLKAKMTMTWTPGNVDNIGDLANVQFPKIFLIWDKDDTGAITIDELLQYQKVYQYQFGDGARMKYSTHIPLYVRNSLTDITGGTGANGPLYQPWIDMGSPAIEHGTLKLILFGTPNTTYTFETLYSLTFACKNVR